MFRSALLTLTKCLASTGLKTSTYLLPYVFRDFISVHQHTACLMGGSTSSCVSVWYAAGDELVQQEPRKGSERNDLSVDTWRTIWRSCFALNNKEPLAHSPRPETLTHSWPAIGRRGICAFMDAQRAPSVFWVPAWLIPNYTWQTQREKG